MGSAYLNACLCCKETRRLCWLLVIACGLLILGCCFWCVGCWFVLGSLLRRGQFVLGWCVDSAFTLGGGSMLGRVESMNVEWLVNSSLILSCLIIESRLLYRRERVVGPLLALEAWRESHHPSPFPWKRAIIPSLKEINESEKTGSINS